MMMAYRQNPICGRILSPLLRKSPQKRVYSHEHHSHHRHHHRTKTYFSTTTDASSSPSPPLSIRIAYGSQTGTSQLFATQLADLLENKSSACGIRSVRVHGLHEAPPAELIEYTDSSTTDDEKQRHAAHHPNSSEPLIFILSCYGVGQPTDNAKQFLEWLHSSSDMTTKQCLLKHRKYAVFGLGNSRTHTQNYNVVGKLADARLKELGGERILELGLGDDSDCVEDDFDSWAFSLVGILERGLEGDGGDCEVAVDGRGEADREEKGEGVCLGEQSQSEVLTCSADTCITFPELVLNNENPIDRPIKQDLFDDCIGRSSEFYMEGTQKVKVLYNRLIAPCRESLREVALSIGENSDLRYQVGDHIWIYPQNHPAQVEAYVKTVHANPFAIIEEVKEPKSGDTNTLKRTYPYPLGLTISETLQHCVDLSAVPSPSLARFILNRDIPDYRSQIAEPRRTALELLKEPDSRALTISELLYQLPRMQPRYYSISSSPRTRQDRVTLTYRPVKYISTRGVLREGVCTYYLNSNLLAYDYNRDESRGKVSSAFVAAGVRDNPEFRLPQDPSVPILMIAGGCGIAPIRSFLDERLAMLDNDHAMGGSLTASTSTTMFGEAYLFFGFRHDDDKVYTTIIEDALSQGVLTEAFTSRSSSCHNARFVASDIGSKSHLVYDLLERGAHVYLCGGALGFAPSCATAIKDAIATEGKKSDEETEEYFMRLIREGRYSEDISE